MNSASFFFVKIAFKNDLHHFILENTDQSNLFHCIDEPQALHDPEQEDSFLVSIHCIILCKKGSLTRTQGAISWIFLKSFSYGYKDLRLRPRKHPLLKPVKILIVKKRIFLNSKKLKAQTKYDGS